MSKVEIASAPSVPRNNERIKQNWKDSASVLKLLDVIASIIADEYIQIAKQNKDVFMDSRFRGNDNEKGEK